MERNTRQRTAIRDAIAQAARPLLPQEVLDAAQADVPGLSIATVYRNLRALLDEGELKSVVLPGENARYELAGSPHHHHFQCLSCQRVFEVDACPGNLASLAPPGFTVEDHDLTLYGRCDECAPRARGGRPKAATRAAPAQGSRQAAPAAAQARGAGRKRSSPRDATSPTGHEHPPHPHPHPHPHEHAQPHPPEPGRRAGRATPRAAPRKR